MDDLLNQLIDYLANRSSVKDPTFIPRFTKRGPPTTAAPEGEYAFDRYYERGPGTEVGGIFPIDIPMPDQDPQLQLDEAQLKREREGFKR